MLGLRDVLFIAPTSSSLHQQTQIISSDHHPSLPLPSSAALGVSVGIFPLLAATPCLPPPHPPPPNHTADEASDRGRGFDNLKRTQVFGFGKGDSLIGNNGSDEQGKGDAGDGSMGVCRDCGNRAKKECEYRRCRTCCKGRGNHCSTHVKSTWVSATRRRERQMLVVMDGVATASGDGGGSSGSSSAGAKRPRVLIPSQSTAAAASHASTSNATTPRSFETTSNHQDASFKKSLPGQVRAPAVFQCHRVTAISSGEGELAYQATVNIGGHVFKGFLYDQGADEKTAFPSLSHLHLESGNHNHNHHRE